MADKLTKATQIVIDGSIGEGSSSPVSGTAETAARIAGSPQANRIYGTNSNKVQGWLIPGSEDFPKVFDAYNADKLNGTPGANKVWGSDANGIQGWQPASKGNMNTAIYDPSNSGKVQYSEIADKLSGSPLANYIWGTDSAARQVWLKLDISDIMLKSQFGASVSGSAGSVVAEVERAVYAEKIRSGESAPNDTVYSKNAEGNFEWKAISSLISSDVMLKSAYDKSGTGKVDYAEEADALTLQKNASNSTVYGKAQDGTIGFKTLEQISDSVMLKNIYDPTNSGSVNFAKALDVPEGTPTDSVWTTSGWTKAYLPPISDTPGAILTTEGWQTLPKPSISIITGGNGSIDLTAGNWILLYLVNGEAKTKNIQAEADTTVTWEVEEGDKSPAWAIKFS